MPTIDLWERLTIIGVLVIIIYTGHRGFWFWSPGVRALATELARERDDWRALAIVLLRQKAGVELPAEFEAPSGIMLPGVENGPPRTKQR